MKTNAPEVSAAPNQPETTGGGLAGISRRNFLTTAGAAAASLPFTGLRESIAQEAGDADIPGIDREPVVIKTQGSFMVGGAVITAPNGDTFHGDHAYVQYQIPPGARRLPLVMWHGGGQFSKTWESTPDGRDGYQNIFLRRGFSTYILDEPRRGRSGRGTEGSTLTLGVPNESTNWGIFRLGRWPDFFRGCNFQERITRTRWINTCGSRRRTPARRSTWPTDIS